MAQSIQSGGMYATDIEGFVSLHCALLIAQRLQSKIRLTQLFSEQLDHHIRAEVHSRLVLFYFLFTFDYSWSFCGKCLLSIWSYEDNDQKVKILHTERQNFSVCNFNSRFLLYFHAAKFMCGLYAADAPLLWNVKNSHINHEMYTKESQKHTGYLMHNEFKFTGCDNNCGWIGMT